MGREEPIVYICQHTQIGKAVADLELLWFWVMLSMVMMQEMKP